MASRTIAEKGDTALKITHGERSVDLPIITGSENETALDISRLRGKTGLITLDPGYANTGGCKSSITFIDGEKGILRYRGYPIEELAEKSNYLEVAWLLIHGEPRTTAASSKRCRRTPTRCRPAPPPSGRWRPSTSSRRATTAFTTPSSG
jgi:hypothetical protein